MPESRWIDAEAVAKILRVRASQVPGMVGRGRIPRPSYHLGYSSPRWDRTVLEASLREAAALKEIANAKQAEAEAAAEPPAGEECHTQPSHPATPAAPTT